MANTSSAKKAIRSQARKQVFNLRKKRTYRDARKDVMDAVTKGDKKAADTALQSFYKAVDKAAKSNGPLHKNTAARYKSRLMKVVNEAFAS